MIQQMLAVWLLVPLPFLNPACTSGRSQFMYWWSLAWVILSITLLACEMCPMMWKFEHSLTLSFFGIGVKTAFPGCHCWVFQICWHIDLLCTVLLCILSISWSFLLLLSLYCCCPLLCLSLDEMFLWYFQFSWRDLLFSSISLHCSLKKAFLSLLAILWNSAFSCVYLTVSPLLSILSFLQLFVNPPLEGFPNLENPAVATGLKRSILIPVPKKGSTKECLNLRTFSLISHASKVMLKMLHARLQHYVNWALSDVQVGFRWGRGTRYQDCLHWLDHRESKGIPE